MFKNITSIILCLLAFQVLSFAQLSEPGRPLSFDTPLSKAVPTIAMPSIDIPALLEEDVKDIAANNPMRFAFGHPAKLNLINSGLWEKLPNGDRIWRLSIHCPEALNINFLYSDFFLPEGAKLFIYNRDQSEIIGAFTSNNNKNSRRFATALIHDDVATLEYFEPLSVRDQGIIEIGQVSHGYRTMDGSPDPNSPDGPCQVNINCSPEGDDWQTEKKGAAKLIMDGLYLCSGSLINNTANDCKPYLLTANHCIMGGVVQDAIINPDVSGYVFYWNYEYQSCSNSGFLPNQTTSGGTVVANTGVMTTGAHTILGSDFALIKLAENPRDQYDVYFNGWDASGQQGNTGAGIHHPGGDPKKIATHHKTPTHNNYYWDLYWNPTPNGYSVTEGGSSGSPLFRENKLILGQLFGGGSVNCDDPANDLAKYGRIDYSWTNDDHPESFDSRRRLHDWLDPIGGGSIRVLAGAYDPCDVPKVYFQSTETNTAESAANVPTGCREYVDYTVVIGITPYPSNPVIATLSAIGSAGEGSDLDYEFFPNNVTFNNIFNQQTFTVRVYDDKYVEGAEDTEFTFTLTGSNGQAVAPLSSNFTHTINIADNDSAPSNQHVQAVTNDDNPTTEYLGPNGTVHFFDVGSGGIVMALENLSNHDFGCTTVEIDHAGASANNDWATGSTSLKTYRITPEFDDPSALVRVTLYLTNSEVAGFEIFNTNGFDRHDLEVLRFADAAIPANESTGLATATDMGSYNGNNFTFSADFQGFGGTTAGFTVGSLSFSFAGNSNQNLLGNDISNVANTEVMNLQVNPNPVSDQLKVQWSLETPTATELRIVDIFGKVVQVQQLGIVEGYQEVRLDVSQYGEGIYFVQMFGNGDLKEIQKIVKIR